MKNISVCSWSYRLSAARVAEEMYKSGVTHVHLALNPFVDPLAVVPGTAGETENVAGTGGVDSLERQRADIEDYLASGRWVISSTLHNSRYDDYSTLESIRRTGGLVPDEHWEENKAIIAKVVKLTAEWKAPYMMLHAGYINHADPVGFAKLTDRLKYVRDLCADAGIGLTLETGQETADDLAEMLTNLPGVYVNFDPANMILYAKGKPMEAVKILYPWIMQVHVKDACETKVPGTWGTEVPWGEGEVGGDCFVAELEALGYKGNYVIEREGGEKRVPQIRQAIDQLLN